MLYDDEIIPTGSAIRDLAPVVLDTTLRRVAAEARTFIFNGSVGWTPRFPEGTEAVFKFMTDLTGRGVKTAIAGGDTNSDAKAARKKGITVDVSVQPTGGGAFLKLLETGSLPIQAFLSQQI